MNGQPMSRALATLALIAELGGIVLSIPLAAFVVGMIAYAIWPDQVVH
jgi:hypothetical protein